MREWPARAAMVVAVLVGATLSLLHVRSLAGGSSSRFAVEPSSPAEFPWQNALAETRFASSGSVPSVHSAAAVEIERGRILAVWYGGTREGAKDVAIVSAIFDPETGSWGDEKVVTTREGTASDLGRYVKKLGNPVVARDARGRLWLFYVSVSVGGWSGSAINVRSSEDGGHTWSRARRLVTSPFLNVSTLVRGPAVLFEDGTLGLPVYHEFLGKFGEIIRIATDEGKVLSKARLSYGYSSLQPVVVPFGPRDAVAFLRRSGSSPARILSVETSDGGESWSDLKPTSLPNPDAGIAALGGGGGQVILAFNDSAEDRSNLKLAVSEDRGESFRAVRSLEPPEPLEPLELEGRTGPSELSYPWLLEDSRGALHLLYTWNRRRIVHVRLHGHR